MHHPAGIVLLAVVLSPELVRKSLANTNGIGRLSLASVFAVSFHKLLVCRRVACCRFAVPSVLKTIVAAPKVLDLAWVAKKTKVVFESYEFVFCILEAAPVVNGHAARPTNVHEMFKTVRNFLRHDVGATRELVEFAAHVDRDESLHDVWL